MTSFREKKLAAQITDLCAAQYSKNPSPNTIITITSTQLSSDMRRATVGVSIAYKTNDKKIDDLLIDLKKDFKKALSRGLKSRHVPSIEVIRDYSIDDSNRISKLAHN